MQVAPLGMEIQLGTLSLVGKGVLGPSYHLVPGAVYSGAAQQGSSAVIPQHPVPALVPPPGGCTAAPRAGARLTVLQHPWGCLGQRQRGWSSSLHG